MVLFLNLTPKVIPIATFSKFPRLAALLEGQEADFAVNAIKASDELALNEAGDAVKRKNPLPEDIDLESRSVFVVRSIPLHLTLKIALPPIITNTLFMFARDNTRLECDWR